MNTYLRLPSQILQLYIKPSFKIIDSEAETATWSSFSLLLTLCVIAQFVSSLYTKLTTTSTHTSLLFSLFQCLLNIIYLLSIFVVGWLSQYFIARLFKGQGNLLAQGFSSLLFFTPLIIIGYIIIALPLTNVPVLTFIQLFVLLFLLSHALMLNVMIIKALHSISWFKTIISFLLGLVSACISCLLILMIITPLLSLIQSNM
jgi:hypothetical protein